MCPSRSLAASSHTPLSMNYDTIVSDYSGDFPSFRSAYKPTLSTWERRSPAHTLSSDLQLPLAPKLLLMISAMLARAQGRQ